MNALPYKGALIFMSDYSYKRAHGWLHRVVWITKAVISTSLLFIIKTIRHPESPAQPV
jgi:hypothetical protein